MRYGRTAVKSIEFITGLPCTMAGSPLDDLIGHVLEFVGPDDLAYGSGCAKHQRDDDHGNVSGGRNV